MAATLPTLAALLLSASTASAAITIPTVSVGDVGNADDDTGYGGVAYDYEIGTHEVTNSQYTAFLNAVAKTDTHGLYDREMAIFRKGEDGSYTYSVYNDADKPVTHVNFWDAARFANWLTNGQPTGSQDSGTTEDGMYNLNGEIAPKNSLITRQIDFSAGENGVAVASADEWYKAAYYDGNGGYYEYPTESDTEPTAESPPGGANSANFDNAVGSVTEVGSYTNSASHYGTFDQGGNVFEWNDTIMFSRSRIWRGGFFGSQAQYRNVGPPSFLSSQRSDILLSSHQYGTLGFRVTSLTPISESTQ